LGETLSKNEQLFGSHAQTITKAADQMAASFGTVKQEFIDAADTFGAMLQGAGVATEAATRLGVAMTKLGMDLSSFGNASNAEVFTARAAGPRGEFDPIERFNVFMSAAAVSAKAVEMGLARAASEVDNYGKKLATVALILEQTEKAQGDLAR